MNLETGDKFTKKKWRSYYGVDYRDPLNPPKHGLFYEGTIMGVLLDMDRGTLNFFKDGVDLGPAFIDRALKTHALYPFVQVQCKC